MANADIKFLNPFYNAENPEVYRYNPKTGLKLCSRCGEYKPISEFWKTSRGSYDGYFAFCKDCSRKQKQEWKGRQKEENERYKKERQERKLFEAQRKEERKQKKAEDHRIYIENRRKRKEALLFSKQAEKRYLLKKRQFQKEVFLSYESWRSIETQKQKKWRIERNANIRKKFHEVFPDKVFRSIKDLERKGIIFNL